MDYYCHCRLGMLALVRNREVPTAVELCLNGQVVGQYLSAGIAAQTVASGLTEHKRLNALPEGELPSGLDGWQQTVPLYFEA